MRRVGWNRDILPPARESGRNFFLAAVTTFGMVSPDKTIAQNPGDRAGGGPPAGGTFARGPRLVSKRDGLSGPRGACEITKGNIVRVGAGNQPAPEAGGITVLSGPGFGTLVVQAAGGGIRVPRTPNSCEAGFPGTLDNPGGGGNRPVGPKRFLEVSRGQLGRGEAATPYRFSGHGPVTLRRANFLVSGACGTVRVTVSKPTDVSLTTVTPSLTGPVAPSGTV